MSALFVMVLQKKENLFNINPKPKHASDKESQLVRKARGGFNDLMWAALMSDSYNDRKYDFSTGAPYFGVNIEYVQFVSNKFTIKNSFSTSRASRSLRSLRLWLDYS